MIHRRTQCSYMRRRPTFERLEVRQMLAAQPVLSEFVASNDSTLNDGFGDDSDWVEIYNAGDESIDLAGYYLTDNASDVSKWEFPAATLLGSGEFLIVFASGEDTIDPEGYLHTNFRLSAGGEYVGLADPTGTVLSEFGSSVADFPPQATDISYGLAGPATVSLLSAEDNIQYWVPSNNTLGTSWTNVGFDAQANGFVNSQNGIGYENSPGSTINFNEAINTTVPSGTTSVYIRSEFDLSIADDVIGLELALLYDDGFALYLNGTYLFGDHDPANLNSNSSANNGRNDSEVLLPVTFSLNDHLGLLQNGKMSSPFMH